MKKISSLSNKKELPKITKFIRKLSKKVKTCSVHLGCGGLTIKMPKESLPQGKESHVHFSTLKEQTYMT
jgi:hypothetical protein